MATSRSSIVSILYGGKSHHSYGKSYWKLPKIPIGIIDAIDRYSGGLALGQILAHPTQSRGGFQEFENDYYTSS